MSHINDQLMGAVWCVRIIHGVPNGIFVVIYGIGGYLTPALLTVVRYNAPVALVNMQTECLRCLYAVCQSFTGSVCSNGSTHTHIYRFVVLLREYAFFLGAILAYFFIMYSSASCGGTQNSVAVAVSLYYYRLANRSRNTC